ncbi:MAG: TerC family protein [Candidatus Methanomethylicus sp.]|nr:TerC family protein [Candidatus Methanomethylicus sp.]
MIEVSIYIWLGFIIFIIAMLALDLGVFQKKKHWIPVKEALALSAFWIALAMVFNIIIFMWQGPKPAMEFLTGYLIEESLSVDNLFVFLIIFSYFGVPKDYWHEVLFYGILGALVMRGIFIGVGIAIISQFHWVLYIFGAILIYTAIKVAGQQGEKMDPGKNKVITFFKKHMNLTDDCTQGNFFEKRSGKRIATPLVLTLISIELTDVVFAMDSVPAIFGVTLDQFIVYTSNVFAILGLRALFFALAGCMNKIHYLNYGLGVILGFIGIKILLPAVGYVVPGFHYEIPTEYALGIVATVLLVAVLASYLRTIRNGSCSEPPGDLIQPTGKR